MTEHERPEVLNTRRLADAVDIHTHTLPGIDDGATTLENSLMMLRIAARFGTSLIVATPHRFWEGVENTPDKLRSLVSEVRAALRETKLAGRIELVAGQEIPLAPETGEELQRGKLLTLGDTGVYALTEPPFDHLPDWTAEALQGIFDAGFYPVLAHPERNAVIQRDPERALPFSEVGAAMQITAMSVMGKNGKKAQDTAFWLIERGMATVIASDCHSPTWRAPGTRSAYHVIQERYGQAVARRLCSENPRVIAAGNPLPAPYPL